MSTIDRQRIAAVARLQALGFAFDGVDWHSPPSPPQPVADVLHAKLMERCNQLAGSTEGSAEAAELEALAAAIEAYELKRWPNGKEDGGKG
jgi:hypothetical protein